MTALADLLSVLSFLASNRGITLRDASRATGLSTEELCRRLESISLCGVPPYSPHDYISYRLVGSGVDAVIDLQFAQHFARPLNFTPSETLALKYALDLFASGADQESAEALHDLKAVLGNAMHGRVRELLAEPGRGFVVPRRTRATQKLIGTLSEAIDGRWATDIEYFSSHRAQLGRRRVYPYELVEFDGNLYLYAWCEMAEDTRHFRLERIRSAQPSDTRYVRRPPARRKSGRMAGVFEGRPRDTLKVRFSARLAREISDEWAQSPQARLEPGRNGAVLLSLPLYNPFWAAGFVASFGPDAELVAPRWLKAELAGTIRSILQTHRAP